MSKVLKTISDCARYQGTGILIAKYIDDRRLDDFLLFHDEGMPAAQYYSYGRMPSQQRQGGLR